MLLRVVLVVAPTRRRAAWDSTSTKIMRHSQEGSEPGEEAKIESSHSTAGEVALSGPNDSDTVGLLERGTID